LSPRTDGTGAPWPRLRCERCWWSCSTEAAQDANKVLAAEDHQVTQACSADRPDPPLGDRVGVGRSHRGADDLRTNRAPDSIERSGDFGVSVADQEVERGGMVADVGDEVAGLLGDPQTVGGR
jgi:hypothetical protein